MSLESFYASRQSRGKAFNNIDADSRAAWHVKYLKQVNEAPGIKRYKNKVLELLDPQPGERILELGCGLGLDLKRVYEYTPTAGNLVGIDISRTMIEQANKSVLRDQRTKVNYLQGDAHTLSFKNGMFDASYSDRTFQHLANPDFAFSEMRRVTKHGGRIVIADTDWSTLQVKGVSSDTSNKIRSAYFNIIANPHMGGELERLFQEFEMTDVEAYKELIELSDFQKVKDILALKKSLDRARKNGNISSLDMIQCLEEVDKPEELVHATFSIYVAKGVKPW